jgi:hypothetical protein
VEICCVGESIRHPRVSFGRRQIKYRHYLEELARKPQALRQVAPELLGELSEPYAKLWRLLVDRYGPADAARSFARILGAVCEHGEERVGEAISQAIEAGRTELIPLPKTERASVEVPSPLLGYEVEQASAVDYDRLMTVEVSDV